MCGDVRKEGSREKKINFRQKQVGAQVGAARCKRGMWHEAVLRVRDATHVNDNIVS